MGHHFTLQNLTSLLSLIAAKSSHRRVTIVAGPNPDVLLQSIVLE
jgi:hypothetical protein